jgi:SPP1 family predicted phage head-tail adaptor
MQAGKLRHRVTVQQPQQQTNSLGEPTLAYVDLFDAWVQIQPLSARELVFAKQLQLDTTHKVYTRWTPDITSDCRLVYNGRILNVIGVTNVDERNHDMVLTCCEVAK